MRLGVISDTHGHVANTQRAVELLQQEGIERVLHCGDIGSVEIPPLLIDWPTDFVFGNVDRNEWELRTCIEELGLTCHDRFGEFEIEGRRIALLHSDDARRFQEAISGGDYDLICYGHTHKAKQERIGGTIVLNPGALYRAVAHTVAIVELPALEVRIVEI